MCATVATSDQKAKERLAEAANVLDDAEKELREFVDTEEVLAGDRVEVML